MFFLLLVCRVTRLLVCQANATHWQHHVHGCRQSAQETRTQQTRNTFLIKMIASCSINLLCYINTKDFLPFRSRFLLTAISDVTCLGERAHAHILLFTKKIGSVAHFIIAWLT